MENNTWIKLYRSIEDWCWYPDLKTTRLFEHLLLNANWEDKQWKDITVPKGSLITSIPKLAEKTFLSEKEVRTALKHLEKTGEVGRQTTSKYSIISVTNYDMYQSEGQTMGSQRADNGQTMGSQRATTKEYKKERREEVSLSFSNENDCRTDVQRVIEAWNSIPELHPVKRISSESRRYQMLKKRIREYGVEGVLEAVDKIKHSDLLLGKKFSVEWFTFDWFVKPNNFPKVMDGNYDNNKKNVNKVELEGWLNE